MAWQVLSLMFKIDGIKLPPVFRSLVCWTWIFTDLPLYGFVRLLGAARYYLEPYLDAYVAPDLLFDPYYHSDVVYFVTALALGFAGTYTLLQVWVIGDYTDPKMTDVWKKRYMHYFWRQGLPYTLKCVREKQRGGGGG